jgi:hypothetical protein
VLGPNAHDPSAQLGDWLTQEPQFVFGEGLSYTTVEYAELTVATPEVAAADVIRASVRLTITGNGRRGRRCRSTSAT